MKNNSIYNDYKIKSILFIFFILCVFPFIFLAQYNLPLSDEFVCMHFKNSSNFIEYQKILFTTWSGRYVSNLLEIIYPLNIYYPFYQFIPVILITLFYLTILLISKKLVYKNHIIFSIFLFIILLNYLPSVAELFYYVPAIIIYTVSFISILILISIWLSEISIKYKIVSLIINNIILLGTTELYIPLVVYFSFILLFISIKEKKSIKFYIFNLLAILFILLYLFTQKGNLNRYGIQTGNLNLYNCFYNYLFAIFYWTKKFLILIPFIFLLIYIIRKDENILWLSKKINRPQIIIMTLGYFAMFTPLFFINLTYYIRTANVFFIYFIIMSLVISIKIIPEFEFNIKNGKLLLLLFTLIIFLLTGNIKSAYLDIYYGYTKNMSKALKNRYSYLEKNRNSKLLILDKIPKTDYLLMIQDVNDRNDNNLADDMYKRYYHIDSLIIR